MYDLNTCLHNLTIIYIESHAWKSLDVCILSKVFFESSRMNTKCSLNDVKLTSQR